MTILDILNQPITQLIGVVGFVIALQRMGFNVGGAIASFLKLSTDIKEDNRNAMQALLMQLSGQMETLSQHFNHETTDSQNRIETALGQMHDKQDATVQLLKEIKEYGIKCRKE